MLNLSKIPWWCTTLVLNILLHFKDTFIREESKPRIPRPQITKAACTLPLEGRNINNNKKCLPSFHLDFKSCTISIRILLFLTEKKTIVYFWQKNNNSSSWSSKSLFKWFIFHVFLLLASKRDLEWLRERKSPFPSLLQGGNPINEIVSLKRLN